jgi:hypothetical protein
VQKKLIVALSVGLGASLLVIAFLVGRMTAPAVKSVESQPVAAPEIEQPSADVQRDTPSVPAPQPELPTGKTLLPFREFVASPAPATSSPVIAYFAKIDAIQSVGAGDPTMFAQGIVGGLQAGDTSGLDSLVKNAKTALAQATAVQPPPACAEYHRRLLESLSESVVGMERMRSALKSGDISVLSALTSQFQNSQQKVDDLERMRKQLLGQ